jgi:hypothetical protein
MSVKDRPGKRRAGGEQVERADRKREKELVSGKAGLRNSQGRMKAKERKKRPREERPGEIRGCLDGVGGGGV